MENIDEIIKKMTDPYEGGWYSPFCTSDEIKRIENPKTPYDELLRKRARIVSESTRYLKNFIALRQLLPNYSFEKCFNTTHYEKVLCKFNTQDQQACKQIYYGDMFINSVNGEAWLDEKGNKFISVYMGLKYYLTFCNLAFLPFDEEIPDNIRFNAAKIAARIHLRSETMDFLIDPRGSISKEISSKINKLVNYELQFIAGHEFSHHLCNHLNYEKTSKKIIFDTGDKQYFAPVFNIEQKQEFEADINSLERPQYNDEEYSNILRAALIFFKSIAFSEAIDDLVAPSYGEYKDHPSGNQRFEYLLKNISRKPEDFDHAEIGHVECGYEALSEVIKKDINLNYDDYDLYGSMYLDKPGTKWCKTRNTDPYWGS